MSKDADGAGTGEIGAREANLAVVRRVIEEVVNGGDTGLADVLFAHGYVNHGGVIPDLVPGPESVKVSVVLYRLAFPELQVAVEQLTAERDTVVLRWTARGAPDNG